MALDCIAVSKRPESLYGVSELVFFAIALHSYTLELRCIYVKCQQVSWRLIQFMAFHNVSE